MGMRLRDYSESIPKPMVPVGHRPIMWHVMKYYAYFGHNDFILCLGHKADQIKRYFLEYDECLTNDFVLSDGGQNLELLSSDISDWKITFADSGLQSRIGERLRRVKQHLQGEEMFLANYSDGVTDLPLPALVEKFRASGKIACFVGVKPKASFHMISSDDDGTVRDIQHIQNSNTRVNGGYFIFRPEVFDYIEEGDELVEAPFHRLIEDGQLFVHSYDGFWGCMDTYKEKQELDEILEQGQAPWQVWRGNPARE